MDDPRAATSTASGWHLMRAGATHGPYTWADLVAWAKEGRIGPEDLVWHAQAPGWIPARQVPGLFPGLPQYAAPAAARPRRRRDLWALVADGNRLTGTQYLGIVVTDPSDKERVIATFTATRQSGARGLRGPFRGACPCPSPNARLRRYNRAKTGPLPRARP
jgi:hypothetical protein